MYFLFLKCHVSSWLQSPRGSVVEVSLNVSCFMTMCYSTVEFLILRYSEIPSACKILATVTTGFDVCFSALLVLKGYPKEAAVQENRSVLLEDSRSPKGKTSCCTETALFIGRLIRGKRSFNFILDILQYRKFWVQIFRGVFAKNEGNCNLRF